MEPGDKVIRNTCGRAAIVISVEDDIVKIEYDEGGFGCWSVDGLTVADSAVSDAEINSQPEQSTPEPAEQPSQAKASKLKSFLGLFKKG